MVRRLRRNPGFVLFAVLLLGLGIGAATAMFSILDAWLLQPLHFPQADRLTIVLKAEARTPGKPQIFDAYRDWERWAAGSHSFTNIAGVFWRSFDGPDQSGDVFGMMATANLFDTLGVAPERGRAFRAGDVDGPPVAVIGHELWQQRFGGRADVIGAAMPLSGKTYRIVGVMPPGFGLRMIDQATDAQFFGLIQKDEPAYRSGGQGPLAAIGRMRPGVTIAAAQTELEAIQKQTDAAFPDNPRGYVVLVTSLQGDNTRDVRASLWAAGAATGLVLLIVWANMGGLLLGRTLERQREIAVRIALGASRGRIVRQLLAESGLLAAMGAGVGVLLAALALQAFRIANPFGRMPVNAIAIQWRTLAFTVLAAGIGTLLFGLAPALHAARQDLSDMIKAAGRGLSATRGAVRARSLLAAGQIALTLVILAAAALMIQTLARLERRPLGFRTAGVSVAEVEIPRTGPDPRVVFDGVLAKMQTVPGIAIASMTNTWPLSVGYQDRLQVQGQPPPKKEDPGALSTRQWVTSGFFGAMGIPLLDGRGFTGHDDANSEPVAIVSRIAERRWFAGHAVGRRLKFEHEKEWRTVVGVAGDTVSTFYNTVEWLEDPRVYEPAAQGGMDNTSPVRRTFYVVTRGREIARPEAQALLKSVSPVLRTGRVQTMRQMVTDVVKQPRVRTGVLGGFAAAALLLAAIGVYGVMAQSVIERRREIGIRMALGAARADVVRMVAGQGMRIAAVGIAAGAIAAPAAARLLSSLLYGVKPTDAVALLAAAAVLACAALAAAVIPARRAAGVDPIGTLRDE